MEKFKSLGFATPSNKFIKLISDDDLSRCDSSRIFQLRSGHAPRCCPTPAERVLGTLQAGGQRQVPSMQIRTADDPILPARLSSIQTRKMGPVQTVQIQRTKFTGYIERRRSGDPTCELHPSYRQIRNTGETASPRDRGAALKSPSNADSTTRRVANAIHSRHEEAPDQRGQAMATRLFRRGS